MKTLKHIWRERTTATEKMVGAVGSFATLALALYQALSSVH